MRQRNIKNLNERISENSRLLIDDPRGCRGHWNDVFGNSNPIYLEIGCGKGKFITGLAAAFPENNYIAVEGQSSSACTGKGRRAADWQSEDFYRLCK